MSEGQEPTQPDTQAVEGQQTEQEQPNPGTTWTLDAALAELKKANAEAAKWRTQVRATERQAEEAAKKQAEEQGKYKELYEAAESKLTGYEPMRARLEELTEQVKAANEKRIAAIPETMRGLVPDYDDPFKLAQWLEANSAVFTKPPAPQLNGGAGGSVAGNAVDEAKLRAQAVRLNIDPEKYIEAQRARS